jgi:hypothetical protein
MDVECSVTICHKFRIRYLNSELVKNFQKHVSDSQQLQWYGSLNCERIRTSGHEEARKYKEDMVLFTSNNVTILQCVYRKCFKMAAFCLDTQSCPFQHAYRNGRVLHHVGGVVGSVSDTTYVEKSIL